MTSERGRGSKRESELAIGGLIARGVVEARPHVRFVVRGSGGEVIQPARGILEGTVAEPIHLVTSRPEERLCLTLIPVGSPILLKATQDRKKGEAEVSKRD